GAVDPDQVAGQADDLVLRRTGVARRSLHLAFLPSLICAIYDMRAGLGRRVPIGYPRGAPDGGTGVGECCLVISPSGGMADALA
ncbi:MAG: hypothetical protein LC749_09840, partial [Actinobacteria bacterium]|nr:hypothetical protein [Actinomycetota bacterium]